MIWWRKKSLPPSPVIPETPDAPDRSVELERLRTRVFRLRVHSIRAMSQTDKAVAENCFGPKFAAALREAPR